jgi:uncharacterized protein YbjT (DUF2867 family)
MYVLSKLKNQNMYVITGANGNTGHRVAEALLAAGKTVKVIARKPEKVAALKEKGAQVAPGDLGDQVFLTEALRGATAAYLMLPPNFGASDWRTWMREMVHIYTQAVIESGISKVVILSSQGAHRTEGVGPVGGLGELENALKAIPGLDVLALRPGYFMENLYGSVGMIKQAGINGGVQKADARTPIVHTRDIAKVAAQRLLDLSFKGFSYEFITGPADLSFAEITSIVGKGIGKPELPYIEFSAEDGKAGMIQAGLPETIANGYVELAIGMNEGRMGEGYERSQATQTDTSLEWFVEHELKPAILN